MIDFEELGLTGNESKVYETLVKFGKLGAGGISAKSSVPYGRIYDVLGSLLGKGLIKVIPEKTKKYAPGDPESLLKLIDEKKSKLEGMKLKIDELKKFYEIKDKNPVEIGEGRKGFYKIVGEMKSAQNYDYTVKWTSEFRPEWVDDKKKRARKGVDVKELVRYDKETQKNVKDWLKVNKNMKKIDNEGVALSIQDDEEVMIALIKSNVTLLIRNKPFAKLMKKMFAETYSSAENIK